MSNLKYDPRTGRVTIELIIEPHKSCYRCKNRDFCIIFNAITDELAKHGLEYVRGDSEKIPPLAKKIFACIALICKGYERE